MNPLYFFLWACAGIALTYLIALDWNNLKSKATWSKDWGYYVTAAALCGLIAVLLKHDATQYIIMLGCGIGAARVIKGIKKVAGTKPE